MLCKEILTYLHTSCVTCLVIIKIEHIAHSSFRCFRTKFEVCHGFFGLTIFLQFMSAPFRAPDLVIVCNQSSTNLAVKWRHLPVNYFQGKPISYRITYNPLASENDFNFFNVNYTSNTTTLTNLTVYTLYVINISAVSSGGIGPANTVKARTSAEGKDKTPRKARNLNSRSANEGVILRFSVGALCWLNY